MAPTAERLEHPGTTVLTSALSAALLHHLMLQNLQHLQQVIYPLFLLQLQQLLQLQSQLQLSLQHLATRFSCCLMRDNKFLEYFIILILYILYYNEKAEVSVCVGMCVYVCVCVCVCVCVPCVRQGDKYTTYFIS